MLQLKAEVKGDLAMQKRKQTTEVGHHGNNGIVNIATMQKANVGLPKSSVITSQKKPGEQLAMNANKVPMNQIKAQSEQVKSIDTNPKQADVTNK